MSKVEEFPVKFTAFYPDKDLPNIMYLNEDTGKICLLESRGQFLSAKLQIQNASCAPCYGFTLDIYPVCGSRC